MVRIIVFKYIALFLICEVASAQFGVLDSSFGIDGKLITAFGQDNSLLRSIAIQSDGKFVSGGTVIIGDRIVFALARYHPDGTLDTAFGIDGKSTVLVSGRDVNLAAIAIQSDGKIVISGKLYNPGQSNWQSVFVRCNSNGTLDAAFGDQGLMIPFENGDESEIKAFAFQPDGKIIAVGYVTDRSTYSNFLLLRFNSNGDPDTNFGSNGVVNERFRALDFAYALDLQSDGKIIVVGSSSAGLDSNYGYQYDFIVAQYEANGTLDTSFGANGKTIVEVVHASEKPLFVKIQTDGKIIIAGENYDYPYSFMQVRLHSNGAPDVDFGTDGVVMTELPTSYLRAAVMQPDGKIVVTGDYSPGAACCSAIRLIRFQTNGSLDPTFGNGGIISHTLEAGQSHSIVMQADGKIIISGGGGIGAGPTHTDFTMYRYTSGLNLSSSDSEMFKNNFIVYPNPLNDGPLLVDFNLKEQSVLSVNLNDCYGKKIATLIDNKEFGKGINTQKFDLPAPLAEGIYFLKISSDNAVTNIKLIKR